MWGYRSASHTRTLDAHACRLRRKLEQAGATGHVLNRRGIGYRLVHRVPGTAEANGMTGGRPAVARSSSWSGDSMRRKARLTRRTRLEHKAGLRRTKPLRRSTPLARTRFSPASPEQRAKVGGQSCLVCGEHPVDPAHLVPRSLGGCDEPDCVVSLCRLHHRRYDRGQLDLLPYLEPCFRVELQHGLGHLGLLGLLRRVTGVGWMAVPQAPERGQRAA